MSSVFSDLHFNIDSAHFISLSTFGFCILNLHFYPESQVNSLSNSSTRTPASTRNNLRDLTSCFNQAN